MMVIVALPTQTELIVNFQSSVIVAVATQSLLEEIDNAQLHIRSDIYTLDESTPEY
jgi:hypothetical protein